MQASRYPVVSGVIFAGIAVAHALRGVLQIPVQAGSYAVPIWVSWLAVIVTGSLSVWAFRSAQRAHR